MAVKLRKLLKLNRQLEQELYYETRQDNWQEDLITPRQMSEALLILSNRIIGNQSDELSVLHMLNDIELTRGRPLAAFEKNALQVVEILFNYLRHQSDFDKRYLNLLNSMQLAFTKLALNDLSFLDSKRHPAVEFLDKIIRLGHHFDQSAGKIADYFVKAISLLVNRLADKETVNAELFAQAVKRLDSYFEDFNQRVDANKTKILQQVEKESRQAQADFYTRHLIADKTEGDEIPVILLDFFQNYLAQVLHKTIVEFGVKSKQCQQFLTDMDTLSWSITASHQDPDYKTRFDADVAAMMKRLYQGFDKYQLLDDYIKDFFIEIESIHRQKLEGNRVDLDMMIAADIFGDESYDSEDIVSWAEPESRPQFEIDSLLVGKWYFLHLKDQSGTTKKGRYRLLEVSELLKKIYFVNLSGELACEISFDESDWLRDSLSPCLMAEQVKFEHALKALVRELESKYKILSAEKELQKQKQLAAKEEALRVAEEKRQAVLAQIELEKRKLEQKREQERRQKELERKALEEKEAEEARRRFEAKGTIRKLKAGIEVAWQDDQKHWHDLNLMLISKTTQRYIFTNARGEKIIEPDKNELAWFITENRLKVVDKSRNDSDPLKSLVMERRSRLSQR